VTIRGPYRGPAFILSLAALFSFFPIRDWRGLRFVPLCVARALGGCEYDYPRWAGHTANREQSNSPRARPTGFYIMGSGRSFTEERGEEVGMSRNVIAVAIVIIVVVVFVYLILRLF
jgi:hypothetical protein